MPKHVAEGLNCCTDIISILNYNTVGTASGGITDCIPCYAVLQLSVLCCSMRQICQSHVLTCQLHYLPSPSPSPWASSPAPVELPSSAGAVLVFPCAQTPLQLLPVSFPLVSAID